MEQVPDKSTGRQIPPSAAMLGGGALAILAVQWAFLGLIGDLFSSAVMFGLGVAYGKFFWK